MKDVKEKAPVPQELTETLTPEQRQQIQDKAQKLITSDPLVQTSCVALLYAQQLFHCGAAALRRRMEEVKETDPNVEAHLFSSMKSAAMKEFSRHELVEKTHRMILPWLLQEVESEKAREAKLQSAEEDAYEKIRREDGFELPWSINNEEPMLELPRDRSLVLQGYRPAVKKLIEQVVNTARSRQIQGKRLVVCRLLDSDKPTMVYKKSDRGKLDYFEVGFDHWKEALTNPRKIQSWFAHWLKFAKKHRIDMLVVEDLAAAKPRVTADIPEGYHLNEAHRVLRRWCDNAGAFLIAAAPRDEKDPVLLTEDLQQLDIYSELIRVRVAESTHDLPADAKEMVVMLNEQGESDE